ncbi:MAG: PD-(D/E)XK nuclease family protein [Candidatus Aminicenantes bacterium]|jgi:putative RecB family exonuclease|nr:PD-(D/E)XK nuclease family protein [Candidatus Aminicenantes bacterium]MDH5383698.1 PD-(D/E)XK nuclease family protein [Candidatus Aminicenantes bacterium]MDH5742083.1 PD-(D/E)XK nuclease family protein [Candidatus Aminicenantes bacterium]
MPAYSHSKIGTYETCPLQYRFAYIDRVEVEAEDTIETYLGSRVHEVLEKLYRDRRFEKLMTLEELLAHYNKLWDEKWKDSVIIVKEEYTADNYRQIGERQLTDYYTRYKPFDQGRIIGLETQDFLSLDEAGKYKFHIRIDRLMDMGEGMYEVHDYKTGSTLLKQKDLDQDRQLAMYSLWVRQNFKDFNKVRLVWHFLAFDKEMDSFRTKIQLDELRKEVLDQIKEIEVVQDFPANVSWLCDWCLYRPICPMWSHSAGLERKPENEYLNDPGLKLVDEYVRIKGELDEHRREADEKLEKLKEAMIAFCQKEGIQVVFGSENKITMKEYESIKLPGKGTEEREKLIHILEKIGRLDEVSDLNVYALAKILESKDWDKAELAQLSTFWTKEKNYRLTVSKK